VEENMAKKVITYGAIMLLLTLIMLFAVGFVNGIGLVRAARQGISWIDPLYGIVCIAILLLSALAIAGMLKLGERRQ
jgi:hypothetical protein